MALVSVYRFTVWVQHTGENVLAPRFATATAIARVQGSAQLETQRTVDARDLDGNDFYPKEKVWLVEIFDLVSRKEGNTRLSVPHGEYTMREIAPGSYSLSGDLLPVPFELTDEEVCQYIQGKMRVVAGKWP
jgi:hypothetical protein